MSTATLQPTMPPKQHRMTPKKQVFLDAYFGVARLNAAEAARLAGYKSPRTLGAKLLAELSDEVERRMVTIRDHLRMSPGEVLEGLTEIARDRQHKDRIRALELMAKIHGQLSDKISLDLDPQKLKVEFIHTLKQLTPHQDKEKWNSGNKLPELTEYSLSDPDGLTQAKSTT